MTQVYRRLVKGSRLTMTEGDASLEHLSNAEQLTSDVQLYTGGVYQSTGTRILTMPADGNRVAVRVKSGSAQLIGDVDGVTNPVLTPGPLVTYLAFGGLWESVIEKSGDRYHYTDNVSALLARPKVMITAATAKTFTIPAGYPVNTTFDIVRGNALVTVIFSGGETVYNPADLGQHTTLEIGDTYRHVEVSLSSTGWVFIL